MKKKKRLLLFTFLLSGEISHADLQMQSGIGLIAVPKFYSLFPADWLQHWSPYFIDFLYSSFKCWALSVLCGEPTEPPHFRHLFL